MIRQLLHRFRIQCGKKVYNYPFLMGQGVWIDSDKLGPDDSVGEVLRHGTLSVGFIGFGGNAGVSDRQAPRREREEPEAGIGDHQPHAGAYGRGEPSDRAEFHAAGHACGRAFGRFLRMDQKKYGKIPGITDRDYYTNSFHVPVYYPISAFRKIELEAPYHALTNAGHISYVELDGDVCRNLEAFESVIRWMQKCGVGYGSVNHPVDRDPVCGYTGVIDDVCPRCGRREGEGVSVEKLRELRKKYPSMPRFVGLE